MIHIVVIKSSVNIRYILKILTWLPLARGRDNPNEIETTIKNKLNTVESYVIRD